MTIYSGFSHRKLWFSIAMLNYQRVDKPMCKYMIYLCSPFFICIQRRYMHRQSRTVLWHLVFEIWCWGPKVTYASPEGQRCLEPTLAFVVQPALPSGPSFEDQDLSSCCYFASTAQGGAGSFRNRKPTGEVGCGESWMAERTHWWIERWLERPAIYLSVCLSTCLSFSLSICLSVCLSIYLSTYLSTYL